MNARHLEVLRRIKASVLPLAILPPEEDLESFLLLADGNFIDATVRNRREFIIHSITPLGHEALEPPEPPPPDEKKARWPMISALIALAGLAITVMWYLVQLSKQ